MANYKTVPNQKVVRVNKESTDGKTKANYYAAINLEAMEAAARGLGAGAFKLWIYFAKNQDNYEFALSSKVVEETFGMKIKQYNNAIDELIEKNYLVMTKGNNYMFNEKPVIPKGNNDVITKKDNDVITKSNNPLLPKDIRNITTTTLDNTINNTEGVDEIVLASLEQVSSTYEPPQGRKKPTTEALTKREMVERFKREMGF